MICRIGAVDLIWLFSAFVIRLTKQVQLRSKAITEVFDRKLGVPCSSVARIHRLGRKVGKRPVILYFQDFNEKSSVLSNSKKLKGTGILVQNDYSQSTLTKRKKLWESARADKAAGKNVFLIKDKL